MFRITDDPSSGSLIQCLAKNYKIDSIVTYLAFRKAVPSYTVNYTHAPPYTVNYTHAPPYRVNCTHAPPYTVNYTHAQQVRICCHNTDLVHVNGHDRIILVIFSEALYKAP